MHKYVYVGGGVGWGGWGVGVGGGVGGVGGGERGGVSKYRGHDKLTLGSILSHSVKQD